MSELRTATIEDGKLVCPWCHTSGKLSYSEDLTVRYAIEELTGESIRTSADGDTQELASNECLFCEECAETSEIPEGFEITFGEDTGD